MKCHLLFAALAATIPLVFALKAPDCNAFQKTCPSNKGNTEGHIIYDLAQNSALNDWTTSGGEVVTGPDGAEFTIRKQGDAPTIVTDYYIFYGEVSVEIKASPGTGIISSVYMLSDSNDEIDWEALGGSTNKIQTNYYGKGDNSEDYSRWTWQPLMTPQEVFHKYTWIWAKDKISWAIDGAVIRTVDYADAKGGTRFPQTPMRVRIGIWAGDDPSKTDPSKLKGTIEWAGGDTDYSNGPFTMYVKSVEIVNHTPAESYVYSDKSGSSDSIEIHSAVSSDEASSSTRSGTSRTTDTAISTSSFTGLCSSISSSTFAGATTNSSSPISTLPMTSSAEPKSTVLSSNSTSTANSTSNSSTGAIASATSFNSASGLGLGYLALLTPIVGFIQMWT